MHVIGVDVGTNLAHATGIACTKEGQTHDTRAFIGGEWQGEDLNLRPSGYELDLRVGRSWSQPVGVRVNWRTPSYPWSRLAATGPRWSEFRCHRAVIRPGPWRPSLWLAPAHEDALHSAPSMNPR